MKRSWNPSLWAGFALALVAVASYPFVFIRYPITRDFPWVTLVMLVPAIFLLARGLQRAFRRPDAYRGKIAGSVVAGLTALLIGFFLFGVFYLTRQIPASHGAPKLGDTAPDFTLPDSLGRSVMLSSLLNSPFVGNDSSSAGAASGQTAAVLLIFYRGYW
jgi:hypothetical protein